MGAREVITMTTNSTNKQQPEPIWYESKELIEPADLVEKQDDYANLFELNLRSDGSSSTNSSSHNEGELVFAPKRMFKPVHHHHTAPQIYPAIDHDVSAVRFNSLSIYPKDQMARAIIRLQIETESTVERVARLEAKLDRLLANSRNKKPDRQSTSNSLLSICFWFAWPFVVHFVLNRRNQQRNKQLTASS